LSQQRRRVFSEPNWIRSPAADELEGVVRGMRDAGRVARHVTLIGLLDSWRGLVEEVENGYEDSVYEYANDVDSRVILQRVIESASSEPADELRRWLRSWDERFGAATVRAPEPFHGSADAEDPAAASPWHWRIPLRLTGELKADLEAMGLA
jgi:hypothetical protein